MGQGRKPEKLRLRPDEVNVESLCVEELDAVAGGQEAANVNCVSCSCTCVCPDTP